MKKSILQLTMAACFSIAASAVFACGGGEPCPTVQGHFKEMDTNKDGVVSKAEFDAAHNKHFKEIDTNHDGKISLSELEAAHDAHHEHHEMKHQAGGTFKSLFEAADEKHDGGLSKEEAAKMPMLLERFDEFDANKDGKVTYDEIRDAMKIMHRQADTPAAK